MNGKYRMLWFSSFLAISMLFTSAAAFGGSGKATTNFMTNSGIATWFILSNITPHSLDVTITKYDQNGNPGVVSSTTLAARSSIPLSIPAGAVQFGFVSIEWQNSDPLEDDTVGLLGIAYMYSANHMGMLNVNNGLPF